MVDAENEEAVSALSAQEQASARSAAQRDVYKRQAPTTSPMNVMGTATATMLPFMISSEEVSFSAACAVVMVTNEMCIRDRLFDMRIASR